MVGYAVISVAIVSETTAKVRSLEACGRKQTLRRHALSRRAILSTGWQPATLEHPPAAVPQREAAAVARLQRARLGLFTAAVVAAVTFVFVIVVRARA